MTKVSGGSVTGLGEKVQALRAAHELSQAAMAKVLGIDQATLARWETNKRPVTVAGLLALARLAFKEDRRWWLEQAGGNHADVDERLQTYKDTFQVTEENERTVLVFGSAGAGPFRFVPQEAESKVAIPRAWASETASLVGLRITGDSMWPMMMSGSIVIVDLNRRSPKELCGRLVAASDGEGVSVKYLRKAGKSYLLVPKNITVDNQIIPFTEEHRVVGEVIFHMTEAKLLWE